jgi:hypothetical protein
MKDKTSLFTVNLLNIEAYLILKTIAIKLRAEPINILMMQVYMPTSEHEDDEVEVLYDVINKFLEKMERATQTPS